MFSISATASRLLVGDVADDDRHLEQAGALRRAPAPLAGDDLEAVAALRDDDRLNEAVGCGSTAPAPRAARRRCAVRGCNGLGCEQIEVDLERRCCASVGATRRGGRVGNQRAQPAAEGRDVFQPCCALRATAPVRAAATRRGIRARGRRRPRRRATCASYRITGNPWLGASPAGRCAGSPCRRPSLLKNSRMSLATCWPRFVRSSYIVSSTPSTSSPGLSAARTRSQRRHQVGEPFEREVLAVQRNQHRVGGDQRVERQQAERRRRVDEDVVELVAQRARADGAAGARVAAAATSSTSAPARWRSAGTSDR